MTQGAQPNSYPKQRLVVAVDDDPRIRESLRSLFASAAIDAQTVATSEEVLHLCKNERVGCLITDICMPGIDGWELQRLIIASWPHLPLIFVTAHQDERVRQRALALGAFGFFNKPFDGEELLHAVSIALKSGTNP
jgi:FixJ family two-component response regulator